MIVYSIQHISVYKKLIKNKKYIPLKKNIMDKDFQNAYDWLVSKSIKYNKWSGQPHNPIWLWKDKPDLRKERFIFDKFLPKKMDYVLLTLDIPENLLLFSEFGLWHSVLGHRTIPYNDHDDKKLDKKNKLNYDIHWERCLFLSPISFNKFHSDWINTPIQIQGITPFLKKEYLLSIKKFKIINKAHI